MPEPTTAYPARTYLLRSSAERAANDSGGSITRVDGGFAVVPRDTFAAEMKPTPRSSILGGLADALARVKAVADRVAVSKSVPLVGGMTLGDFTPGDAPRILDDASYGVAPVRGKAWATRVDPGVVDVAGLAPLGAIGAAGAKLATKASRPTLQSIEAALSRGLESTQNLSKNGKIRDPKPVAQRPFHDDYPQGTGAGAPGSALDRTIDGHDVTAAHLVGRRTVGGSDERLSESELGAVAKGLGLDIRSVLKSDLPQGAVGAYRTQAGQDASERVIKLFEGLSGDELVRTFYHEMGHAIDDRAAPYVGLQTTGLAPEVGRVYNDLNGLGYGKTVTTPKDFGYPAEQHRAEYIAEAIRAYMQDPNYFKTVAPKTAAMVRQHVNEHPALRNVIQFNQVAPSAGAGLVGYGLVGADEANAAQR